MEEDHNGNFLPWKIYREYYYMSKDDLESIGTNSCFRVRCKLCEPALKTIGTNRSSSSNLRKHMKCIHPEALEEMEKRMSADGSLKGRRKREELQEEATSKHPKREILLGGERELLFQLAEEFTAALDCSEVSEEEMAHQKRVMWISLTSTFNEISGGPERKPEQLKCIWEALHNDPNRSNGRGLKVGPPLLAACTIKVEKNSPMTYSEEVAWESAVTSDEPEMELADDMSRPIIMTDENSAYTGVELGYQNEVTIRQNGYEQGRELHSKQNNVKKKTGAEQKLHEQQASDHKVRLDGLKQELDLKKEILREELEHQRRLKKMELTHRKILNSMERTMKQEAFRAEERRKEEKHGVEMSILRMSARISPQMQWKNPGIFRGITSLGTRLNSSPSKSMQDDTKRQADGQSSSSSGTIQSNALAVGKKNILLQHSELEKSVEDEAEQANEAMMQVPKQVCIIVNGPEK